MTATPIEDAQVVYEPDPDFAGMFAYWPGALTNDDGWEGASARINKNMARKMHSYKKDVFTRSADPKPLEWHNAENVVAHTDEDLVKFISDLKSQPGGDIHVSGGATLAQNFARLGLIDEYRFSVFPLVSAGARWFDLATYASRVTSRANSSRLIGRSRISVISFARIAVPPGSLS